MKKILGNIEIRQDWDEKVSWYKDSPKFVSPLELEANKQISDFLLRKEAGALIVSGDRGAGKTTTLINSVRLCEKDTVFPVYLNSAHLESYTDSDLAEILGMLKILKLLIRSLSREIESKGKRVPFELVDLLHDCEATKISRSHTLSVDTKMTIFAKLSSIWNLTTQLFPKLDFGAKFDSGVDSSVSYSDSSNFAWEKTGLTIEDFVDRFSKIIKILEKKGVLSCGVPKYWNIKLKLFGKQLGIEFSVPWKKKQVKKLVFILDELDVYDGDGEAKIKPKEVLSALKKFKNLFTLSSAHFIFIVGKNTFLQAKVDPYRTLFTDRIYLSTPDGIKLSNFLDGVVVGKINSGLRQEWDELKWYFIMSSRHNLFDLITYVNSFCDYDQKDKRLSVRLIEMTQSEKVLTSFHYLLNSIFVYHKQSSIFENSNDDLFAELLSVENNFKKYLLQGTPEVLSLDVRDTGNIDINVGLKEAKIALIKSLFLYSNKKAPIITTEQTITLPWDEFRQTLSFQRVKGGIVGAVTNVEIGLIKDLNGLLEKVNQKYGKYLAQTARIDNLKKTLDDLSALLNVSFITDDISLLVKAIDQITNVPVDRRNWEQITQAMQSLSAVSNLLNKYLPYGDSFEFRTDYGSVVIDKSMIQLGVEAAHGNKLTTRMTAFLPKLGDDDLAIRMRVKLSQGSLFDVLLYKEYSPTELESDFYMIRLDCRQPESSFGDCILYKPKGASWDIVPESTLIKTSSEPDKEIDLIISVQKKILELRKKKGRGYQLISRTKIDNKLKFFGISNELASVDVKLHYVRVGNKTFY